MVADSARSCGETHLTPGWCPPQNPESRSPVGFHNATTSGGWWCGAGTAPLWPSMAGLARPGAVPRGCLPFLRAFRDRHLRRCSARLVPLARATTMPGGRRPSKRTCAVVTGRRRVRVSSWDRPLMWHAESHAGRVVDNGPRPRLPAHSWWLRRTAPRGRRPSGGPPFNREAVRGAVTPSGAPPTQRRVVHRSPPPVWPPAARPIRCHPKRALGTVGGGCQYDDFRSCSRPEVQGGTPTGASGALPRGRFPRRRNPSTATQVGGLSVWILWSGGGGRPRGHRACLWVSARTGVAGRGSHSEAPPGSQSTDGHGESVSADRPHPPPLGDTRRRELPGPTRP